MSCLSAELFANGQRIGFAGFCPPEAFCAEPHDGEVLGGEPSDGAPRNGGESEDQTSIHDRYWIRHSKEEREAADNGAKAGNAVRSGLATSGGKV